MKLRNGKLELGQKVFVYRNLHTGTWSVKDHKTKRVVRHCDLIYLRDVDFKVSKKGNARVKKEKKKNVHAGVEGLVYEKHTADFIFDRYKAGVTEVTYDPYKYKTFVVKQTGEPIYQAQLVMMKEGKVYVYDVPNHI